MSAALNDRYGVTRKKKSRPRGFWYLVAALACLLAVGLLAWGQFSGSAQPTARDTGFKIISTDQASGSFELVKDPQDTAVCAVEALDKDHAPVGWKEVTIGPSNAGSAKVSQQEVTLRTLSEATTVTVDSCWKP